LVLFSTEERTGIFNSLPIFTISQERFQKGNKKGRSPEKLQNQKNGQKPKPLSAVMLL
jgi:hypothetical protein